MPYTCRVLSANIDYTFLAVVNEARKQLTWCKIEPDAVLQTEPDVPISPRCKA